ncbi:alginate export family protein [Paraflavitalea sp. CAU 1676]|uniref:alginate export family protein n=1 Tax=Paraflavitalea sp. CAU 1676 TaxID=3032598 RepID=UPI0023DC2A73|nr:alginate export family protein [Paraflavitalea sp. CAU 1676]MDF2189095.1 alginate export family protein [Paraflavitalea sp. CAU 1676]
MKYLLAILLSASLFITHAQTVPAFKPLRYEEDYSRLQNDSARGWYERTKYSPLNKSGNTYVSLGGEARFQYFHFTNEDWGEAPKDKDGYVLARYLLHADLHTGHHFRAFLQLQSSLVNGKLSTSPVEENPLEVHQAFADAALMSNSTRKLIIRIGRQELLYGIQRIIAVRDGPNNRQSFDAARAIYTEGPYRLDVFYGHFVAAKKGIFNDGFNQHAKLYGLYLTRSNLPVLQNIDFYYLGHWRDKALFDEGIGKENRHSLGAHTWGASGGWRYDAEGLYQLGSFAGSPIHAWTASLYTSYKWKKVKFTPELGLKTELISGDKQYDDGRLNTFNPLYPRGAYFGQAALIGPVNLFDIHPSLSLSLTKKLTWNVDYDLFWRYSRNDGIYGPNVALLYSGKGIADKHIGDQLAIEFIYTPNPFLYFRAEFTWFNSGAFLKAAGPGKDILFTGLTAQVKF